MAKKIVPINYTSRDFQSIKDDLIQHAKRYYSDVYKDFNQASFGSLMLDTTAYVGDILSFYLDYQANESFLDTAAEFENIIKLGRQVGYKFANTNSSTGIVTFFISVPASTSGLGPNMDYAPVLKKGSSFSTKSGTRFILNEDVRFDDPRNEIRVSLADPDNGFPLYYAIKAQGTVVSGIISSERVSVGDYKRYQKFTLSQLDIIEILSIYDLEGNQYFEVDNLSQNIIYRSVTNRDLNDAALAREVLKPIMVPRRFVVDRNLRTTSIQFGASSDVILNDSDSMVAEPTNVVLNMFGKDYISSDYFDPTKLLNSDKMGVAPSNTELIVTYRYNNTNQTVNFATNTLVKVVAPIFEFPTEVGLSNTALSLVKSSLEITNEVPLLGDTTVIDSEELKKRIENSFSTQGRAVTEQDYKSLIYSMPNKYGSVKRVAIMRDSNSLKRNLNLYILCEGADGFLTTGNQTVKSNIKNWLLRNKMINDSIDILDGKVVNYGITFTAIGSNDKSKYDTLSDAINQLKADFSMLSDFGETLNITDVYNSLKKVSGIIDVVSVSIDEKIGGVYSDSQFSFKANTSSDGRYINVPANVVMELKYPNSDIKGTIL
jgi:hypothetical protein